MEIDRRSLPAATALAAGAPGTCTRAKRRTIRPGAPTGMSRPSSDHMVAATTPARPLAEGGCPFVHS